MLFYLVKFNKTLKKQQLKEKIGAALKQKTLNPKRIKG